MSDVTEILGNIDAGQADAADRLLRLVHEELRAIAAAKLAGECPGQTLEATGLVHEAYLRLIGPDNALHFANRKHFFAAAAEAMRRILVDNARRKKRQRHGGEFRRVALADVAEGLPNDDLLALDDALRELAQEDETAARVVELRHFTGLGLEQVAEILQISAYQARQKWSYARAWLRKAMAK